MKEEKNHTVGSTCFLRAFVENIKRTKSKQKKIQPSHKLNNLIVVI